MFILWCLRHHVPVAIHLTLKVNDQERLPILEKEGFPQYDMKAEIDDQKCVTVHDLRRGLPARDAIDRNVPAYEGTYKGPVYRCQRTPHGDGNKTTFIVDKEKCSLCGLCGALYPWRSR